MVLLRVYKRWTSRKTNFTAARIDLTTQNLVYASGALTFEPCGLRVCNISEQGLVLSLGLIYKSSYSHFSRLLPAQVAAHMCTTPHWLKKQQKISTAISTSRIITMTIAAIAPPLKPSFLATGPGGSAKKLVG